MGVAITFAPAGLLTVPGKRAYSMIRHLFIKFTSPIVGIVVGATYGWLVGWLYSPHSYLRSDWAAFFALAGTIVGAICGGFIRLINIVFERKNITHRSQINQKFADILSGATLGNFLGAVGAVILGSVMIASFPNEIYFTGQIDYIYFMPLLGMVLGGIAYSTKHGKLESNLIQSVINGVGFGILSTIALGLFLFLSISRSAEDFSLAEFVTLLLILSSITFICSSLFGIMIAVISEAASKKMTYILIKREL